MPAERTVHVVDDDAAIRRSLELLLDAAAAVLEEIAGEAREDPEMVKGAPYKCAVHKRSAEEELDDPDKWATTWKAYKRKHGAGAGMAGEEAAGRVAAE